MVTEPPMPCFPHNTPKKAPATGQDTHPGGGGRRRQLPGAVPAPWECAVLGSCPRGVPMGSHGQWRQPLRYSERGWEETVSGGFLCLAGEVTEQRASAK